MGLPAIHVRQRLFGIGMIGWNDDRHGFVRFRREIQIVAFDVRLGIRFGLIRRVAQADRLLSQPFDVQTRGQKKRQQEKDEDDDWNE